MRYWLFGLFMTALLLLGGCSGYDVPEEPVSVVIEPQGKLLPVGTSIVLSARGIYADGRSEDVSGKVYWHMLEGNASRLSEEGVLFAEHEGFVKVGAEYNGVIKATAQFESARLQRLVADPVSLTLSKGFSSPVKLEGLFVDGRVQPLDGVLWQSSDSAVATVDEAGRIAGVESGTATIRAMIADQQRTISVTVNNSVLQRLEMTLFNEHLYTAMPTQGSAKAYFSDGRIVDVTYEGEWSSSNTNAASIDAGGFVTTKEAGESRIVLRYGVMEVSKVLLVDRVKPVALHAALEGVSIPEGYGYPMLYQAEFEDERNETVLYGMNWSVSDDAVLHVDPTTGRFIALESGSATVQAHLLDLNVSVDVNVSAAPLESLQLRPDQLTLTPGSQAYIAAYGIFADALEFDVSEYVLWESQNPDVALVGITGFAEAKKEGQSQISASLLDFNASMQLFVSATDRIEIVPASLTLVEGSSEYLSAMLYFADGNSEIVTFTGAWSSGDDKVASVDADGLVRANGAGVTTVRIDYLGVSASVEVTVLKPLRVAITQSVPILVAGASEFFGATVYFADADETTATYSGVWSSDNPDVATVDADGNVTGVKTGSAKIEFTYLGLSDHVVLNVVEVTLMEVILPYGGYNLSVGSSDYFGIRAVYKDTTSSVVTYAGVWSSDNPSVATVDNDGYVTGISRGSTQIHFAYYGIETFFTVTIY